ncbi:MAG: radical SAM/SPASM domain-containing protein [Gammaproteobacteria bacterium]
MKNEFPWRITFDTNPDDCNLRCIMCEDHSPYSQTQKERRRQRLPKRRMNFDLIERVLKEAGGKGLTEIIPSTMGEPLVYKQFEDIVALCHQYGVKLNLTTNGTFPKKGAEEWAKIIVPVGSDVKISWNGASKETQEKIMLGTQWEKMLENLKVFIHVRDEHAKKTNEYCRVTLQMTFLETNLHELEDIVILGAKLGVDRIKGHHLWAHFEEIKSISMRRNEDAIRRWNAAVDKAQKAAKNFPLPSGKLIKLENIYLLDENATKDLAPGASCPFLGKEAWVASDGRFNPCCAPDQLRRELGDFGNLNDTNFTDIWNSEAYNQLCKNYMKNKVCQECNMRTKVE